MGSWGRAGAAGEAPRCGEGAGGCALRVPSPVAPPLRPVRNPAVKRSRITPRRSGHEFRREGAFTGFSGVVPIVARKTQGLGNHRPPFEADDWRAVSTPD